MAALEPVFTGIITVVSGIVGGVGFRYFTFFRKNKVEDRSTETERLEAENKRANLRADSAEADADRYLAAWNSTREHLFREQEYSERLRRQLIQGHIEPQGRGE